jgi:hypothetical protein
MRTLLILTAASLVSLFAHAAEPSCTAVATEKKLAGAAKSSNVKKCVGDAVGS